MLWDQVVFVLTNIKRKSLWVRLCVLLFHAKLIENNMFSNHRKWISSNHMFILKLVNGFCKIAGVTMKRIKFFMVTVLIYILYYIFIFCVLNEISTISIKNYYYSLRVTNAMVLNCCSENFWVTLNFCGEAWRLQVLIITNASFSSSFP